MNGQRSEGIPKLVAVFVCLCFAGGLGMMAYHSVPAENVQLLDTMLGVLGTSFSMVVMYYFGSSVGSKAKDATIAAAVPQPNGAPTPAQPGAQP